MVSRFSRRTSSALITFALLLAAAPLAAQTYTLAPVGYQTVLNNNGDKVSNACVWTYSAGTTTPIATYSDNVGTVNTNPIRPDSAGRFTAYLVPGTGYKFVYEQPCTPPAHGAVLRTADNVVGTPSAAAVTTGTWIPSLGGTTTYTAREGTYVRVGALVFARGTMTVNVLGTGNTFIIAGLPFPIAGDTTGTLGIVTAGALSYVRAGLYGVSGASQFSTIGSAAASATDGFLAVFGNGTSAIFTFTYQTLAP